MDTKRKVLIMIAADQISGPAKGVLQLVEHAATFGFEYVLCNFNVGSQPGGEFVHEARRRKLNVQLLNQRTAFDPNLVVQARRLIVQHEVDIIQTHGYKSNTIGFLLRRICRRPWIGFAHGFIDDNTKNRLYNRIERWALRGADRLVAVSDSLKGLLVRHGIAAEKIRVIHNAIAAEESVPKSSRDDIRRRHGIGSNDMVVGVFGRLNPEKGQQVFLKALQKTLPTMPRVKALIVGDGQDRPLLEEFCRASSLGDHVVFVGYRKNIADYYQAIDLLVQPSFSEGSPNTVLEAMSFGVPVLATAVGGVPEIIESGNGVMIPPGDVNALANSMIELLSDAALRTAIGASGRSNLYPRFSADTRVRAIVDLYEELLPGRTATQRSDKVAR
jgi:glycosyltransferase involved in cell wall biosynthesis